MYTSKCAQMDPQQLPKTSKFYSKSKKCDTEQTLGGWVPSPLGSSKANDAVTTINVALLVLMNEKGEKGDVNGRHCISLAYELHLTNTSASIKLAVVLVRYNS